MPGRPRSRTTQSNFSLSSRDRASSPEATPTVLVLVGAIRSVMYCLWIGSSSTTRSDFLASDPFPPDGELTASEVHGPLLPAPARTGWWAACADASIVLGGATRLGCAGAMRGRKTVNTLPTPGSLCRRISPPNSLVSLRQTEI